MCGGGVWPVVKAVLMVNFLISKQMTANWIKNHLNCQIHLSKLLRLTEGVVEIVGGGGVGPVIEVVLMEVRGMFIINLPIPDEILVTTVN